MPLKALLRAATNSSLQLQRQTLRAMSYTELDDTAVSRIEVPKDVIVVKEVGRRVATFTTQKSQERVQVAKTALEDRLEARDARKKERSSREDLAMELARQNDQLDFVHSMLAELAKHENAVLDVVDEELERIDRQRKVQQSVRERRKETMEYLRSCL